MKKLLRVGRFPAIGIGVVVGAMTVSMLIPSTAHADDTLIAPPATTTLSADQAVSVLESPAAADGTTTTVEAAAVAAQLAAVDPTGNAAAPEVPTTSTATVAQAADLGDAVVSVPKDPSSPTVIATDSGATIKLTDPSGPTADNVVPSGDGVSVSNANNGSLNATTVTPTGIQKAVVITSATAPTRYDTVVGLSAGQSLQPNAAGGYDIVDEAGTISAQVAAPWASDAAGNAVPTHYELNGNVLTQVIDFHAPGVQLPVSADPFWSLLGSYLTCIFGVGVPIGVAWVFVTEVGAAGLYNLAVKKSATYRAGGSPVVSSMVRPYVTVVYNNCRRFILS